MAPTVLTADLFLDAGASLAEAPLWDADEGAFVWVDILAGRVALVSPAGEALRSYELGHSVGAALPAEGGGWLVADALGFGRLDRDGRRASVLDLLADRPDVRCNDAKCDPRGRAWAGTLAEGEAGAGQGTLYRLDPGPVATPVLEGLTVSNGLGWSPDARTMWFADSADPLVRGFAYDVDGGELGERRGSIDVSASGGVADGLCVDDEGAVWVGIWGGGAVHRYAPDGRLDTIVRVPATNVTSCAFGGPGAGLLVITTARAGLSADALAKQPHAGGLFVVEPGVSGPAATPWRPGPDRA